MKQLPHVLVLSDRDDRLAQSALAFEVTQAISTIGYTALLVETNDLLRNLLQKAADPSHALASAPVLEVGSSAVQNPANYVRSIAAGFDVLCLRCLPGRDAAEVLDSILDLMRHVAAEYAFCIVSAPPSTAATAAWVLEPSENGRHESAAETTQVDSPLGQTSRYKRSAATRYFEGLLEPLRSSRSEIVSRLEVVGTRRLGTVRRPRGVVGSTSNRQIRNALRLVWSLIGHE